MATSMVSPGRAVERALKRPDAARFDLAVDSFTELSERLGV